MKRFDFDLSDITNLYNGPVGIIWEMLMGEEIHVGGVEDTDILAHKAGIKKGARVLDICSALGGPARHLVNKYGCYVTGIDAAKTMYLESIKRTKEQGLEEFLSFVLGNALDLPFPDNCFEVVWGQDAWCYITDKEKLIKECYRVTIPGGVIAFTDWLETDSITDKDRRELCAFMVFPYLETLSGYSSLLRKNGYVMVQAIDLNLDFYKNLRGYYRMLNKLCNEIINKFGTSFYKELVKGVELWAKASEIGKVSRGRIIGYKN